MDEKRIKTNTNYFTKNYILRPLGAVMAIIGFLIYFMAWNYLFYILMSIFIPGGIILFVIGSLGNSSESDLIDTIEEKTVGLEVRFEEDKYRATRSIVFGFSPLVLEGHKYEDGVMLKKAKSGILRSSEYTKAIVYTLEDGIYITCRSFSLVADEVENTVFDISYADIEKVELLRERRRLTFKGKSFEAKITQIKFVRGGEVISLPIHDDIESDEYVEKLNKLIAEKKASI